MHLITFMYIAKPNWFERFIIFTAQALFVVIYLIMYSLSSKTAHCFVGYLEEETVQTVLHDLNQTFNFKKEHYNFLLSTVSLQFLKAERIPSLLNELQEATMTQGFHYMVFPIKSEVN